MKRSVPGLQQAVSNVLVILFLLFILTKVLLNHSAQLNLEARYVNWSWLVSQYDMTAIEADASYLIDNKVISQFGNSLFVDATPVIPIQRPLLGGIALDDVIALATDDALILLSREGEFIERLGGGMGLPSGIQNIGVYHGDPVLQAINGMWRSNFMLDEWELISLEGVSWSTPYPVPDKIRSALREYFYGQGIPLQKLLEDIHDGRIFGEWGVWLIDGIALLIIIFAVYGLAMWGWRR